MLSNYKVDNKSLIRLFSSVAHRIPQTPGALLTYYFSFFRPNSASTCVFFSSSVYLWTAPSTREKNIAFSYDISRHL